MINLTVHLHLTDTTKHVHLIETIHLTVWTNVIHVVVNPLLVTIAQVQNHVRINLIQTKYINLLLTINSAQNSH